METSVITFVPHIVHCIKLGLTEEVEEVEVVCGAVRVYVHPAVVEGDPCEGEGGPCYALDLQHKAQALSSTNTLYSWWLAF